jgi:uncharacterized protein YjbJ (UPF0337 family)
VAEKGREAMDRAKGLAKEAAGTVTGNEDMKAEGRLEREEGAADEEKEMRAIVKKSVERSAGKA